MDAFPLPLFALSDERTVFACNESARSVFCCGLPGSPQECCGPSTPCGLVGEAPESEDRINGRPITWTPPGGSPLEFELSAAPLHGTHRIQHLAVLQDVTERRRAQIGMQTAAEEWTRTFDSLQAMIVIIDPNRRIRRINLAARDALGKTYQQIIHRPLSEFATIEPFSTVNHVVKNEKHVEHGYLSEFADWRSGKTWTIAVSNFQSKAGETRTILLVRDTTELARLRESLRISEAFSTLGSLVAGVAHQVRNPLFTISATLDTLDAMGASSEQHSLFVSVLRQQVQRLDAVMQDLLKFGRPQDLVLQPASVSALAREAVEACRLTAEKAGVTVDLDWTNDVACDLCVDSAKLFGAIQNVIENAVQHSPSGGTVHVSVDKDGDTISVQVTDSGEGFRDFHQVFEPFFTRRPGGTGLGLPIAKRVVEQHGGKIAAMNTAAGRGQVTITLPSRNGEVMDASSAADRGR